MKFVTFPSAFLVKYAQMIKAMGSKSAINFKLKYIRNSALYTSTFQNLKNLEEPMLCLRILFIAANFNKMHLLVSEKTQAYSCQMFRNSE